MQASPRRDVRRDPRRGTRKERSQTEPVPERVDSEPIGLVDTLYLPGRENDGWSAASFIPSAIRNLFPGGADRRTGGRSEKPTGRRPILRFESRNRPIQIHYRFLPLAVFILSPLILFHLFPDIFGKAIAEPTGKGVLGVALCLFIGYYGLWLKVPKEIRKAVWIVEKFSQQDHTGFIASPKLVYESILKPTHNSTWRLVVRQKRTNSGINCTFGLMKACPPSPYFTQEVKLGFRVRNKRGKDIIGKAALVVHNFDAKYDYGFSDPFLIKPDMIPSNVLVLCCTLDVTQKERTSAWELRWAPEPAHDPLHPTGIVLLDTLRMTLRSTVNWKVPDFNLNLLKSKGLGLFSPQFDVIAKTGFQTTWRLKVSELGRHYVVGLELLELPPGVSRIRIAHTVRMLDNMGGLASANSLANDGTTLSRNQSADLILYYFDTFLLRVLANNGSICFGFKFEEMEIETALNSYTIP